MTRRGLGLVLMVTACASSPSEGTPSSRTPSSSPLPTAVADGEGTAPGATTAPGEHAAAADNPCSVVTPRGPLASQVARIASDDALWEPWLSDLLRCHDEGFGEQAIDSLTLYPHLGALRARLLQARSLPAWREGDRPRVEQVDHLLALWSHADDEAIVAAWLSRRGRFARRPRAPHVGRTADEAAASWSKAHFERELREQKDKRPPPHSVHVEVAPDGDRALVLHSVHYAHWGYSQWLVVVGDGQGFRVQLVAEHEHWHMD